MISCKIPWRVRAPQKLDSVRFIALDQSASWLTTVISNLDVLVPLHISEVGGASFAQVMLTLRLRGHLQQPWR